MFRQSSFLNKARALAETRLSSPATYSVFADGADTDGVGVGDALGDADGEDVAFDDGVDFGEADDDGLGEDEASGLITALVTPVSCRAPAAWPLPPDLLGFGLELDDGLDDGVDFGFGFELDDGDGVGVVVGRGVVGPVGELEAAAGNPEPAG